MIANYIYFISSLPVPQFNLKMPFSFNEFTIKCEDYLLPEDLCLIKNLPQVDNCNKYSQHYLIKKILDFETLLRNELVKIRAAKLKIDSSKYLRLDGISSSMFTHIALAACRNPSVLEAEKLLDEARFNYLDELLSGHYFDLEFLIVYAYKLKILDRWQRINTTNKENILEEVLKKV